jgi:hypothetical protein
MHASKSFLPSFSSTSLRTCQFTNSLSSPKSPPKTCGIIKKNAAQLCNHAILNNTYFRRRAEEVKALTSDQWLTPQHWNFKVLIDRDIAGRMMKKKIPFKRLGTPFHVTDYPFRKTAQVHITWTNRGLELKLDEPGPAFLSFLEWVHDPKNEILSPGLDEGGADRWSSRCLGSLCGLWIQAS